MNIFSLKSSFSALIEFYIIWPNTIENIIAILEILSFLLEAAFVISHPRSQET